MQACKNKPQSKTVNSSLQCEHDENSSWELFDLIEMQTEFALCQSMAGSKTLAIMFCLRVMGYGGFILFLLKMAS
ncbi:hypothetical protein [Shewanella pealeana]|uniref:hypothetical protein n=1 Tax=Shewanella pealeana TaxID=70864 RepID=UPI0002F30242|nr:hypothetical protein [Shewanella pealeana]